MFTFGPLFCNGLRPSQVEKCTNQLSPLRNGVPPDLRNHDGRLSIEESPPQETRKSRKLFFWQGSKVSFCRVTKVQIMVLWPSK